MQFGFTRCLPGRILVALMAIGAVLNAATAQQSIDVSLRVEFGNASQIIIPQSRGFVVNPRSPVEQRGQAIMIDSVEARVKILEQAASTTVKTSANIARRALIKRTPLRIKLS